jgi:hypothetical protein
MIESFVEQNDGVATLDRLRDHTQQIEVVPRIGGEMARGDSSLLVAFTANARPFAELRAFQRPLGRLKIDAGGGVLPETVAVAQRELDASLESFAAAGWPTRTLNEAFYAFERIGVWGTTSSRRTAATADLLSPLTSRPFLESRWAAAPVSGARTARGLRR